MICLATPRLLLRTWRGDDLDALVRRFGSTTASHDIGNLIIAPDPADPNADDLTILQAWFVGVDQAWTRNGFGLFVLERLDDGAVVGLAGLEATHDPRRPRLVWRVCENNPVGESTREAPTPPSPTPPSPTPPSPARRSLSVEALAAITDWAFGLHDLDEVKIVLDANDLDATDVARSAGFRLSTDGVQLADGYPVRQLSVTHSEWATGD